MSSPSDSPVAGSGGVRTLSVGPHDSPPDEGDREPVIVADGVSKRFASYRRRATSLKERLVRREQTASDDFWALRGVDVVVHHGETVGLMGPNGSGKSTLLKVLAGILRPNEGHVAVVGRVASLLELGAGFDGELTGRENVYLNAALLGIPRHETDALFDKIVEFSELGEFIEYPVKHYSSGMYVRLGFAVAVHVDPDILIVDEVLAVGDAAFQRKCLSRIEEFQRLGKTILFVSHSPGLVEQLCTRSVLLNHGEVVFDGPPTEAVTQLNRMLGVDRPEGSRGRDADVVDMQVVDIVSGEPVSEYQCGAAVRVHAVIQWHHDLPAGAKLSLHFTSPAEKDPVVEVEPPWHFIRAQEIMPGTLDVAWTIDSLPDTPGDFTLNLGVYSDEQLIALGRVGTRLVGATRRTISGQLELGPVGDTSA